MSNIEEIKEYSIKPTKEQTIRILKNATHNFEIRGEELYFLKHAIINILAEREQDKKRIKELEEERAIVGMPVKNKRSNNIGIVLHQWESGSVAVLENISPRVINTHDSWDTLEIMTDKVKQTQTKNGLK